MTINGVTLTPRDEELAVLIYCGKSNREIGKAMGLTENSAKTNVHRLLTKLSLRGPNPRVDLTRLLAASTSPPPSVLTWDAEWRKLSS